jgi:FPC/CPF motif-containing protein YcgG
VSAGACFEQPSESRLLSVRDGQLVSPDGVTPEPKAVLVHNQFRAMVLSSAFPCLGASGALRRDEYQFAVYSDLGSRAAVEANAKDLHSFVEGFETGSNGVAVLVACFGGPVISSEEQFEQALFGHLESLHRVDERREPNPAIDPTDDDRGFIFHRRNFFIVGFHPAASRWARRFAWPVLVFNSLSHEVELRKSGKYDRVKEKIRDRDVRLQGSLNPSLDLCQAAQFSGRTVGPDWNPPGDFT